MRSILATVLIIILAASASAYDLGNQAPVKPAVTYPGNVPNPERQGGDTIATAFAIPALPFVDSGTTAGYVDDYSETCPYPTFDGPDVVYSYTTSGEETVDIDLCGSDYDTKVYVYDEDLSLIGCNDDYYFNHPDCLDYVSKLENVHLTAGAYFIVVDGYASSSFGPYLITVTSHVTCVLDCPPGGMPEGEPPLVENYVDNYNSGCSESFTYWQQLTADATGALTLCGVSGWYLSAGSQYRDTDWYVLTMGAGGSIEITGDAEYATYLFELGPQDCNTVGVIQLATAGPCAEDALTVTGYAAGAPVWFWCGPTVFAPPPGADMMYDYVVWFAGLEGVIANEPTTWSTVKALYD